MGLISVTVGVYLSVRAINMTAVQKFEVAVILNFLTTSMGWQF